MYLTVKYAGHIAMLTGKMKECVDVGAAESILDIITALNERYTGFMNVFKPEGKMFNYNTAIYLRRVGEPTISIIDETQRVREGDVLFFW
jgi:hypothetical protein